MCALDAGFKLCSCDGQKIADPDWVLERLDPSLKIQRRVGRAAPPRYSPDDEAFLETMTSALDEGTCFDFAYNPTKGDVLTIRVRDEHFGFGFLGNGRSIEARPLPAGVRKWFHSTEVESTPK